ncbi:MAG: MarR family winged helix-turn-helix transcriptional regulator [Byssovorax sp.]
MGSHASTGSAEPRRDVAAALNAFRRIVRALRLSSSAAEKATGVSGAQLFVLGQLAGAAPGDEAGHSIAELARRAATDPSSVSVVVARLAARGLVARRTSASDARRAEVVITAAGRRLLGRAPSPAQALLVQAIAQLPPAEVRALAAALERVAGAMGLAGDEVVMFFEQEKAPRRSSSSKGGKKKAT